MTNSSERDFDVRTLLDRLCAASAEQRVDILCNAGPLADVFARLCAAVEESAITQVSQAVVAAEIVVNLAAKIGESRELSRAKRAQAQALAYAGQFDQAAPAFAEAIEIAECAELKLDAAHARLASIHALVHLARYDEAIDAGEAARSVFLEHGEALLAGRADSSLGGVCQKRGDQAAALRHFERAQPLLRAEPVLLAQLDSNRGLALQSLDDFAAAEQAFRAALPALDNAGMGWACAIVEGNLAVLYTRQGRIQAALQYFERARRHLDRDSAPAELARLLVEQAEAYFLAGSPEMALPDYEAALPILEQHGQVLEALQARAGFARGLALSGSAKAATSHLQAATEKYDELGQTVASARLSLIRAELTLASGDATAAYETTRRALGSLARDSVDVCVAHDLAARAALHDGQLDSAERSSAAAVALARKLGISPLLADVLQTRGRIHRACGELNDALCAFSESTDWTERVRGSLQAERLRSSFLGDRAAVYEHVALAALDIDDDASIPRAFEAAERAKSRSLLDALQPTWESGEEADPDDAPSEQRQAVSRMRAELNAAYSRMADGRLGGSESADIDALPTHIARLERGLADLELRLSASEGAASLFTKPDELGAVQALLAPNQALIQYFIARDELLAIVVRRDGSHVFRHLASRGEIEQLVRRVQFQINRALRPGVLNGPHAQRLTDDARRVLQTAYQRLLQPLEAAMAGVERLIVVPHGDLHALPLHACWDGARYLAQRYEISYAPSASLMAQLKRRDLQRRPETRAVSVGVADEVAPQIDAEARRVAQTVPDCELLLGPEATVARVQASAQQAEVLHLACHGIFAPNTPEASGIRLADRWLTVREISELRLSGSLVTLAGCETGRSLIGRGDELLGLVRAFLAGGARAIIASRWIVDDESSAQLMADTYNRVTRAEQSTAAALRAAQLEQLRTHPHPARWAPYVLIGDA